MLFFLVGGFFEDVGDRNKPILFGLRGKIGMAVPSLGFTAKCRQDVGFCPGPLDARQRILLSPRTVMIG